MNPRSLSTTALLLTVLALSGCAVPSTDADGSMPAGTSAPSSSTSANSTPAPSSDPGAPASEAPPAPPEGAYVDYVDGSIEATAGPKVLFFHAGWCPQCRQLDEELRTQGAPDGLTVFKVDYDSRSDLRQKYGVTLQTTIVFVDDRGELVSSAVLYDDPSVASLIAAIP